MQPLSGSLQRRWYLLPRCFLNLSRRSPLPPGSDPFSCPRSSSPLSEATITRLSLRGAGRLANVEKILPFRFTLYPRPQASPPSTHTCFKRFTPTLARVGYFFVGDKICLFCWTFSLLSIFLHISVLALVPSGAGRYSAGVPPSFLLFCNALPTRRTNCFSRPLPPLFLVLSPFLR